MRGVRRYGWMLGLVGLLGVAALVLGQPPVALDPVKPLRDHWAQHWPQDDGPPLYPDAHDIRREAGDSPFSYNLTYTTEADFPEINQFYEETEFVQKWGCLPQGILLADYRCIASGKPEGLPWNWRITRHLGMLSKGTRVTFVWWREPALARFPIYPGGRVTQTTQFHIIDGFSPLLDLDLLRPYPEVYATPAAPEAVAAFYRAVLPLCGGVWTHDSTHPLQFQSGGFGWGGLVIRPALDGGSEVAIH